MGGSKIHVNKDVKKSVKGDGKRNEYNYIEEGVILTTMCIIGMQSLNYSFIYIICNFPMKY